MGHGIHFRDIRTVAVVKQPSPMSCLTPGNLYSLFSSCIWD